MKTCQAHKFMQLGPRRRFQYHTYALRCWREPPAEGQLGGVWRYSLYNPRTGRTRVFADLPALFTFLDDRARQSKMDETLHSNKQQREE